MKRKTLSAVLALALLLALLTGISGCGKKEEAAPAASSEPTAAAAAEPEETAAADERQDGERFEATITIEGMEETVRYEHLRNESAGFAMDYDYEKFVRQSETDRERFVSVYDDAENPEDYLEIQYCADDAETVAGEISEALSAEYTVFRETRELANAGECIHLDASADPTGKFMPDVLWSVYLFPADDGCRVATARCAIESAEGFGVRFRNMLDTLIVLERQGELRLSNDQALSAVRQHCFALNPDLEGIVSRGEYPVSWTVESGDDAGIVILFKSYTGAELRYHVDPVSGETTSTERPPIEGAEEQPAEEDFNAWDCLAWWRV